MDVTCQVAVLNSLIEDIKTFRAYPLDTFTRTIYAGTTKTSPARRLLVDFWALQGCSEWLVSDDLASTTCSDFVNDLVVALLRERKKPAI